jgi:hypothetical protein
LERRYILRDCIKLASKIKRGKNRKVYLVPISSNMLGASSMEESMTKTGSTGSAGEL